MREGERERERESKVANLKRDNTIDELRDKLMLKILVEVLKILMSWLPSIFLIPCNITCHMVLLVIYI